ncbi:MAG: CvpA family protein [Patescibacteria group bacterium]
MNTIDLVILIAFLIFGVLGFVRGFIQEVGSILGLFVGFFVAGKFAWPVAHYIRGGFAQYPAIADVLSYIAGFFLVFLVVTFIFGILVKTVDKLFNLFAILPFLKTINRLGGALVGFLEGALLIATLLYMLTSLPINILFVKQIKESTAGPIFLGIANVVKPFLPDFNAVDLKQLMGPIPSPSEPKK